VFSKYNLPHVIYLCILVDLEPIPIDQIVYT
jgi:hypothetical protein